MSSSLTINGTHLIPSTVADLARHNHPLVVLDTNASKRMQASVDVRDRLLAEAIPIYGVTTGFGDSCDRQISPTKAAALQHNMILYHLNGVGPPASPQVTRATMLIRANSLARGTSGIRPEVVHTLLKMLAANVLPLIPERGSVGASGDLIPLSYLAAALVGEGDVLHGGVIRPATEALAEEGIAPVVLAPKEGLALVNGTSFAAAYAVIVLRDAEELIFAAEAATAMALDALQGNSSAMHSFIHENKPHPGQLATAKSIRDLVAGSKLSVSSDEILLRRERLDGQEFLRLNDRVQDPYSIRCAPQIIGIARDTLTWAEAWLRTEINSSTDNPLFSNDDELHLGGNFYAGHIGQAMDSVKVALANVAGLLDRQMSVVVDEKFNRGLPPNLITHRNDQDDPEAGLHHGFKGMQIAVSALTAEAMKATVPASVFSRSTEAHNQDIVSMGTIAARDARTVISLVGEVTAIHLLAVAQAVELRGIDRAAPAVQAAHTAIRACSAFVDRDRRLDHEITKIVDLVTDGTFRASIQCR